MFWVIVIAVAVLIYIIKADTINAARIRNSIKAWFMGTAGKGPCSECKYCIYDPSHWFSETDWYCRISRVHDLIPDSEMVCFEKIKPQKEKKNISFFSGKNKHTKKSSYRTTQTPKQKNDNMALIRCSCGAMLRHPTDKGKIEITCPKCGNKMIYPGKETMDKMFDNCFKNK
ncbi:MAG: hypothetical protein IJF14_01245 [Clostridia bacterium]|nr:hypothetical protein [Clostridia bacterium]